MHVRRHDRGDDLMDRGVVQTREIFELATEAKFEECIPQPVSTAVGLLVEFQQRAARLAAKECDAGTDTEEKENVEGDGGRSGLVDPVGHHCERRSLSRSAL